MFPGFFETSDVVLNLVKILFLTGFFFYAIFAFIAVRQIDIMRKTVITPLSPIVQIIGYLHLLLAVGAFIFAFTYL
jgi:hypothetical protein